MDNIISWLFGAIGASLLFLGKTILALVLLAVLAVVVWTILYLLIGAFIAVVNAVVGIVEEVF